MHSVGVEPRLFQHLCVSLLFWVDFPRLLCCASFHEEFRLSWNFVFRGVSPFVELSRGASPFVEVGFLVEFRLSWTFFFVGASPFVELGFLVVLRLLCRFRRNRSRRVS